MRQYNLEFDLAKPFSQQLTLPANERYTLRVTFKGMKSVTYFNFAPVYYINGIQTSAYDSGKWVVIEDDVKTCEYIMKKHDVGSEVITFLFLGQESMPPHFELKIRFVESSLCNDTLFGQTILQSETEDLSSYIRDSSVINIAKTSINSRAALSCNVDDGTPIFTVKPFKGVKIGVLPVPVQKYIPHVDFKAEIDCNGGFLLNNLSGFIKVVTIGSETLSVLAFTPPVYP